VGWQGALRSVTDRQENARKRATNDRHGGGTKKGEKVRRKRSTPSAQDEERKATPIRKKTSKKGDRKCLVSTEKEQREGKRKAYGQGGKKKTALQGLIPGPGARMLAKTRGKGADDRGGGGEGDGEGREKR